MTLPRRLPVPGGLLSRPAAMAPLLFAIGCATLEEAAERWLDDRTPRERYESALDAAGLAGTALAADWLTAGARALAAATPVTAPHEEIGYLLPAEPTAIGLQITARRGQALHFEFLFPGDSAAQVFLDIWEMDGDGPDLPRRVAVADSGSRTLRFEPRHDGNYLLRAQPELLRGGRFTVSVRLAPTLAFPVSGRRENDIGSRFGAPRDGGRRQHHGVDIFAPRGTPIVATSSGTVSRVGENTLGGLIVWLQDDFGNRLYYAHLDRQLVTRGQRVGPGDTIGTVGNTGNARTTPPHLHFGVYRRGEGPLDPWWFIVRPRGALPRLAADTTRLGDWIRVRTTSARLHHSPVPRADTLRSLEQHTTARVVAAVGEWYRVRLPDGTHGFLQARATESVGSAIAAADLNGEEPVRSHPGRGDAGSVMLEPGTPIEALPVLGRFENYLLVRTPAGGHGWIEGR